MNIKTLVKQVIEHGEDDKLEAKEASEIGKSILETVCALSNEPALGGGIILLGVKEEENSLFPIYTVVGVNNPQSIIENLANKCNTTFNVPVRISTFQDYYDGKLVIAVSVSEASPSTKPVYFKAKGLPAGAFRRAGTSDVQCTEDDLLVLYEGRQGESYDRTILRDASFADIDPRAIEDYRRARSEVNAGAEELSWPDDELLYSLGCLDKASMDGKPTIAGILLFGKSSSIRRLFPMNRVDYIRVPGREWVQDVDNRFESIDMRAPIMSLIRRTQTAILDDLPKGFSLAEGEVQRQDRPVIPTRVIREAVVNALMHRNYRAHQPVQIIRYANRVEIRNPGYSLKSEERLGEPGSQTRNPMIAAALHETNFAETKGSGVRVMRQLMGRAGLTPPLFESDRSSDSFAATFLFHHFLSEEDWKWLGTLKDHNLNDEEARALVFIREVGAINNSAYRNINQVDTLKASNHLRRLRDLGLIEVKGKGSATYYVPTSALLGNIAAAETVERMSGIGEAGQKIPSPGATGSVVGYSGIVASKTGTPDRPTSIPDKDPSFLGKGLGIPDSGRTIPDKEGTFQASDDQAGMAPGGVERDNPEAIISGRELPVDVQNVVNNAGQRAAKDKLRQAIVKICDWKPHTAGELASLLKRNKNYLSDNHLSEMVDEGILEYLYPDMPKHPQQGYRTKSRTNNTH